MTLFDTLYATQAEYWDCNQSERLSYDDPIEALEYYVDCYLSADCDVEAEILKMPAPTLEAYARNVISEEEIRTAAQHAFENVCEGFSEEYGDPDGDADIDWKKHFPAFEAVVKAAYMDAKVWRCDSVKTFEISNEDLLGLMMSARPDWFVKEIKSDV